MHARICELTVDKASVQISKPQTKQPSEITKRRTILHACLSEIRREASKS